MLSRLRYFITSCITLLVHLKNPFSLITLPFTKKLALKNGIVLHFKEIIDVLIIKETILDDDYALMTLPSPNYILDVGAAIGDFSIFAGQLFPQATIIGFEPTPHTYALFKKNIAENLHNNISAIHTAIGTQKEYTISISNHNVKSSAHTTTNSPKKQQTITIPATPLDTFITREVDLIKIDCEGAELDILLSIRNESFAKIKNIVLEYHNHIVEDEDKKICSILEPHNFTCRKVSINNPFVDTGYIYATNTSFIS